MCLILAGINQHPNYKLIIAANRDEFFDRSTKEMHWWGNLDLLAGKDLRGGGTWMGINSEGRFAALTNYRQFPITQEFPTSRGEIILDFFSGKGSNGATHDKLHSSSSYYEGYNLIYGHIDKLSYFSNKGKSRELLSSGFWGLSNAFLNTPWPKIERGKKALSDAITKDTISIDTLLTILEDTEKAPKHQLPNTGIGMHWERELSPLFIATDNYGTRTSTVLLVDKNNQVTMHERDHLLKSDQTFNFEIQSQAN